MMQAESKTPQNIGEKGGISNTKKSLSKQRFFVKILEINIGSKHPNAERVLSIKILLGVIMTVKRRSVLLGILSVLLAMSCAFMLMTSFHKASAVVNDSVYHNLIENGDFENEYSQWGVNGQTPERVADGDDNHVGKLTGAGFVQARLWNAAYMYDQLYKISFRLKLVSSDADATLSTAQYLARLKANDGAFLSEDYVPVGCESGTIPLGEWKTYTYYLKVADNRNGTYEVFAGMDYAAMKSMGTASVELSYFDIAIGCGNFGNLSEWYIDDYTMTPFGEYVANLVDNGDFEKEYTQWGFQTTPVRTALEDGNHVGKVQVSGGFWTGPRIWNAAFMYGKTYRVSFNIKLVGGADDTALGGGGQFLALVKSNDGGHIPDGTYMDIGANNGCKLGSWKTYAYYIRIEKGEENDVLYMGTSVSNIAKKLDCTGTDLSHLDLLVGCGANGNVTEFYLDDYAMTEVDGNLVENSGMTDVFVSEGQATNWGMNSFATTSTGRYWDADKNSYVIKNVGGGWLCARLWKSSFEFGKLYRISADLKYDTTANMNFQFKLSDSAAAEYTSQITMTAGGYTTAVGYFRLDKQQDNSVVFSYGNSKATVAATTAVFADADAFSHLDCKIGPGSNDDAWYIDNVSIFCVSPDEYDAAITVLDENEGALSDYTYVITGSYADAALDGNVLCITGIDGEISVEIRKDGYVGQTVEITPENAAQSIKLVSADQSYNATLTVKDSAGNPVTGFAYNITGDYESAAVDGNVIRIEKALGELSVTVTKSLYIDVTVTVTDSTAEQNVTFDKRAITPDPTNYTGELYSYASFENVAVGNPFQLTNEFGLETFINGGANATLAITDKDSHYANQSMLVNSVGDRLVFRMSRVQGYSNFDLEKTYHATFWLKGITEGAKIVPSIGNLTYFVEGDVLTSGANQTVDDQAKKLVLGAEVTLSTSEWTKIEVEFSTSVKDGKLYVASPYFDETRVYESSVANKKIVDVGWLDLSLGAAGNCKYYLDDVTFFTTYTAKVEVLNSENEKVTQGVTVTATDFAGNTLALEPTIDTDNNLFVFENVYGVVNFTAQVDGQTHTGSTSSNNASLTLANPYSASVAVLNGAGETVSADLIYDVYAMDGAKRIEGIWDETLQAYTFANAMGDLKVYIYAQGFEQHNTITLTRLNAQGEFRLNKVPSTEEGLRGNTALNGDIEDYSQIEMYNNREYAYPEIQATGASDRWASFAPVLTLSDESAVGEKSLRISSDTAQLAADDQEYAAFMEANELQNKTFGDRVSYRAGNAYLLDGTTYCFTVYAKAPNTQAANTKFSLIYLASINLCNGGAFNFWMPIDVTVSNEFWSKIEIYYSFEISEDEAANATGKYEFTRSKLTGCVEAYLNGELLYSRMGVYDYNVYKDGTYAFYTPGENGEMEGWSTFDSERHDGIKNEEGGRSFGSISMVEPSFQILSANSLLIDGCTITSEYKGSVEVLNKDLTPNAQVAYLRLTDLYTGEVIYLNASEYYDAIDQKYYIPELYRSYSVCVCDADKTPVEGLSSQNISSEVKETVIEFDYDIKLTLKDQNGNAITDVVVRILLANGSNAEATNNGDGTYTYTGLSGVRQISFRKVSGSENSYTFPSGITVSSAHNEFEVEITLKTETTDPGENPEKPKDKKGCSSSVASVTGTLAGAVLIAGCLVALKKKKD